MSSAAHAQAEAVRRTERDHLRVGIAFAAVVMTGAGIRRFVIALACGLAGCGLVKLAEWDESSSKTLHAYGQVWVDRKIALRERYFTTEGDGMQYSKLKRYLIDEAGVSIDLKDAFWALQRDGTYKRVGQEPIEVINTRLIDRDDRLFAVIEDSQDRKRVTDCFAYRGDPATVKTFNKDYLTWGEFDPQQRRFLINRFIPLNSFLVLTKKGYTGVESEQIDFSRPIPFYCDIPLDMTAVTERYKRLMGDIERLPEKE